MLTQTFKKSFENVIYHLVAVGNTNVGKSTVLNDIIGHCLLNTSERRETIFHWHIRFPLPDPQKKLSDQQQQLYTLQTFAPETDKKEEATPPVVVQEEAKGIKSMPSTKIAGTQALPDLATSFTKMADLIKGVRNFASNDNLSKTELDTIAKVRICLPNSENKILQGSDLNIVDLPGIENYFWASKIESYLEKHQNTIIPLFIIDLTQGGFDLSQF